MPFDALFRPLSLGSITLKNRVGMSALTRNRAKNSYPTELMKEYYVQRAIGGAGLIVTEGNLVSLHGYVYCSLRSRVHRNMTLFKSSISAPSRDMGRSPCLCLEEHHRRSPLCWRQDLHPSKSSGAHVICREMTCGISQVAHGKSFCSLSKT